MRDVIKGKKWLLLSRWKNLAKNQRGVLNRVFHLNRRVFQGLSVEGEPGTALGLSLRGRHAELPAEVDRSTTMAAPALLSEARGDCCSNTSKGF